MGMFSWLGGASISEAEIRAEVWKLGVRHHGEACQGALEELKGADLSAHRADLLRACVRRLRAA